MKIKNVLLLMMLTVFAFSCKNNKEQINPTETEESLSTRQERVDVCELKNKLVKLHLYGHTYLLEYYDDSTNTRLDIPGLFSATTPNKLVWNRDGSGVEYLYTGDEFNHGTFIVQNCGSQVLINTLFLNNAVLTITKLNSTTWEGTIPASATVPIKVKVKATKIC